MADWLCPHTPDICEYAETCATKLAAELALLKGPVAKIAAPVKEERKFLQVTVDDWSQVIAVDTIARVYKIPAATAIVGDPDGEKVTMIQLKNGEKIVVEESIKTIQARIGCELLP